jgi:hypothetical protein
MSTFDENKHPRGQAGNAGQFRARQNSRPAGALNENPHQRSGGNMNARERLEAAGITYPTEMGSSELDMWEERQLRGLEFRDRVRAKKNEAARAQESSSKPEASSGTVSVNTPKCIHCGLTGTVEVSSAGHELWRAGTPIQDAFTELPLGQREQLKSGIHEECWAQMFGGFDE